MALQLNVFYLKWSGVGAAFCNLEHGNSPWQRIFTRSVLCIKSVFEPVVDVLWMQTFSQEENTWDTVFIISFRHLAARKLYSSALSTLITIVQRLWMSLFISVRAVKALSCPVNAHLKILSDTSYISFPLSPLTSRTSGSQHYLSHCISCSIHHTAL